MPEQLDITKSEAAIVALETWCEGKSTDATTFARSLVSAYKKYGRLSDKQWYYVNHIVASEVTIDRLQTIVDQLDPGKDQDFIQSLLDSYTVRGSLSQTQWTWATNMVDKYGRLL